MALLDVGHVAKRFGGLSVLRDVDFSVAEGEIVGFIGPNGAGKSTLFNVICGVYAPNGGTIAFDGRRIEGMPTHAVCALGLAKTSQARAHLPDDERPRERAGRRVVTPPYRLRRARGGEVGAGAGGFGGRRVADRGRPRARRPHAARAGARAVHEPQAAAGRRS